MRCSPTKCVFLGVFTLVAAAVAAGCARDADAEVPAPTASTAPPPKDKAADTRPDPVELVRGNTRFALDLYAAIRAESDGNIIVSPQSISTALGMTYAGARGETAEQMRRTLCFDLPASVVHPSFAQLEESILAAGADDDAAAGIAIANRLWGQEGETFLPEFLDIARSSYRGGFETLDFANATEHARRTINTWVEDRTNDRIQELLQPDDVGRTTALVLTNAIWFKGRWAIEFDPDKTRSGDFHAPGGRRLPAKMMTGTARYRHHDDDLVQVLELPYGGDRFSMVILLPKTREGLAELEKALTVDRLGVWIEALDARSPEKVIVTLPRFRATSRYDLSRTLSKMGMPIAFSGGADFSGMNGKGGLFIARVIHQAFVEVNEKGTEAAAATAVVMGRASYSPPVEFTADHPFVYVIRDGDTGSVMFLGRVCDPGGEG